jgi:hypothetical protein
MLYEIRESTTTPHMMTTCQPWTLQDTRPGSACFEARSFFAVSRFQFRPLKRRGRGVGWRTATAAAVAGVVILAGRTASGRCAVAMEGDWLAASYWSTGVLLMLTTYIQY